MKTNNFTNIRKTSKSFLGLSSKASRSCLMKKETINLRSPDTVPVI
jgi:hypothetical protein